MTTNEVINLLQNLQWELKIDLPRYICYTYPPWHKPDAIGTSVDEVISQLWWYKNIMCLINLFLILFILRCAKINSSKYDLNVYQCWRKFVFSIWHKTQWLSWLFTTCIIIGMVDWANTSVIGWGWVLFFAKFLMRTIFAVFRLVTWNVACKTDQCCVWGGWNVFLPSPWFWPLNHFLDVL